MLQLNGVNFRSRLLPLNGVNFRSRLLQLNGDNFSTEKKTVRERLDDLNIPAGHGTKSHTSKMIGGHRDL